MVAVADSGTFPPTGDATATEEPTTEDIATDAPATDAPADQDLNTDTSGEDMTGMESGFEKDKELDTQQGGNSGRPYGIVAGVFVAALALVFLRKRSARNAKLRKHRAELMAEEYKDTLEMGTID